MLVTLSGIVTLARLPQSKKAPSPKLVTLLPIVTLVRPLQLWKTKFPMLVTLSGIVTLVRLVQSQKAQLPMPVTGFPSQVEGISNSPEVVTLQSLMVTVSPTTSYVKGSPPLTSLTPPNSNITAAAKVEIKRFFNWSIGQFCYSTNFTRQYCFWKSASRQSVNLTDLPVPWTSPSSPHCFKSCEATIMQVGPDLLSKLIVNGESVLLKVLILS